MDAAIAGTNGFTEDFQDLITRYAWEPFGDVLGSTIELAGFSFWR